MAERQFDFYRDDDSIGTLQILAVPVVGGGGGGSGTDDRVDLINGSATLPLISVKKATLSGVSGVIWQYDDGTTDGLNVFVADGTGLNTVKSAIEAQLPLFGTYTEGAATVDAIAVGISLTYAQITTAVSNGRQVYLSASSNSRRFAYVGTHTVNGTTSHVFSEVECAVNQNTGDTNGTLRTIVYPSSGSAYMYDLALKPVKSTITASDTNPVNSVAVTSYAQPLTDKVSVSGASVTQALDADKMYVFGEVTALTVTLNTSSDSSHVHEYHFRFTSGSTATSLSLPSSVTMPSDFTVEASKTYEISIVDEYGAYVAW